MMPQNKAEQLERSAPPAEPEVVFVPPWHSVLRVMGPNQITAVTFVATRAGRPLDQVLDLLVQAALEGAVTLYVKRPPARNGG